MKYIRFPGDRIVIFPNTMNHSDFLDMGNPVSAGFCKLESYKNQYDDIRYKAIVWGRSESLNIESNQDDAILIEISMK